MFNHVYELRVLPKGVSRCLDRRRRLKNFNFCFVVDGGDWKNSIFSGSRRRRRRRLSRSAYTSSCTLRDKPKRIETNSVRATLIFVENLVLAYRIYCLLHK